MRELEVLLDGDWLPVAEITGYPVKSGVRYVNLNAVEGSSHYKLGFTLDSASIRFKQ